MYINGKQRHRYNKTVRMQKVKSKSRKDKNKKRKRGKKEKRLVSSYPPNKYIQNIFNVHEFKRKI